MPEKSRYFRIFSLFNRNLLRQQPSVFGLRNQSGSRFILPSEESFVFQMSKRNFSYNSAQKQGGAYFSPENRCGGAPALSFPGHMAFYAPLILIILKYIDDAQRQKRCRYRQRYCTDYKTRYFHFPSPPSFESLAKFLGLHYHNKRGAFRLPPFAIFYHVHRKM